MAAVTVAGAGAPRSAAGEGRFRRLAVCGGSGFSLYRRAVAAGAELLLTGDLKYHDARLAETVGVPVIDAGHYATERPVLPVVAAKIKSWLRERQEPGIAVDVFTAEDDPLDAARRHQALRDHHLAEEALLLRLAEVPEDVEAMKLLIEVYVGTAPERDDLAVAIERPGGRDGKDSSANDGDRLLSRGLRADRFAGPMENEVLVFFTASDALDREGMNPPVSRMGPADAQVGALK